MAVPGDVTRQEDLRAVAVAAVEHFGWIDTWINNATSTSRDGYRTLLWTSTAASSM